MKSGWKTTEFWLTFLVQFVNIAMLLFGIPEEIADSLTEAIAEIVPAVFTAIVALVTLWKYIQSRTEVKQAFISS